MPNIGSLLRDEIVRLARRETRGQVAVARKSTAQHRRDIAALKRQVATLERQVKALSRRTRNASPAPAAPEGAEKLRFVAKGLRSHRARLGLSAGDFGRLVGVSANSIYAWESGKTSPRRDQVRKIAAVRLLGKREAAQRLQAAG